MDNENKTPESNVIPLRDVTADEARAEALADSIAKVNDHMRKEGAFVFASIGVGANGAASVNIHSSAETHQEFLGCVLGLVTTLGMAELGDGAENMPPEILHAVAMSTGMKTLNESARDAFHKLGVARADAEDTKH